MIFRNWVLENFPFLEDDFDALTDYELFCKMVEYMKESLKKVKDYQEQINVFSAKLDEFQHYFDNLDVQEEINNKLDEMADSGELTDIIAQYLQLAGVLAFNTVADLIDAENLANGSFAQTSGFYSYNDGGGALYKIRTIVNTDVVNDYNLFALTNYNNLVAELIPTYKMSVKCLGAYGDGIHDDTDALQYAIEINTFGTVYFDKGEYLISIPLKTYVDNIKQCNIEMEKTTIIKANSNIGCLIELGGLGGDNESVINRLRYIKGGILDATNCDYGLKINEDAMGILIKEMEIKNFDSAGIYVPSGDEVYSSDLSIIDCYINGKGSHLTGVGVYLERPDNKLENLRINGCHKCIYATQGGQFISNVHGLGIGTDSWFSGTVFLDMHGGTENIITNSYCDTLETFVKNDSNDYDASFILTNSIYFSYLSSVNVKLFTIYKTDSNFTIKNNNFRLPTPSTYHQGIIYTSADDQNSLRSNQVAIEDNIITNAGYFVNGDLILTTHKYYKPFWSRLDRTLATDKWVKVGYITPNPYSWYDLIINLDGNVLNPQFKLEKFDNNTYITYRGGYKTDSNLSVYMGVKYENNTNGLHIYGLYIKPITQNIIENIEVKQQNENLPFMQLNTVLIDPTFETIAMDTDATL